MQVPSGSESSRRPWLLLLGPGPRLAKLPTLLRSLPTEGAEGRPASIRALEELGELLCEFPESGRILIDSEAIVLEDVGLLRAFVTRHPHWRLELCGSDASSGAARRLLGPARGRWRPWPLDLEDLAELLRAPDEQRAPAAPRSADLAAAGQAPTGPAPTDPARGPRPHVPPSPGEDSAAPPPPPEARTHAGGPGVPASVRAEIERILGSPGASAPGAEPGEPALGEPPAEETATALAPSPPAAQSQPDAPGPAPYFRDQVADLADIAQRIELAAGQARERAQELPEAGTTPGQELSRSLEELEVESFRLGQFTRTLGYLAAPPPRGEQPIQLGEMLEEVLTAAGGEVEAPRFLYKVDEALWVRADKGLLAQALDAALYLAARCAGADGTVRVRARSAMDGREVRVSVEFPAGLLSARAPRGLLEPYALRQVLPELGPNALAAATGIVRGQGGELVLEPGREGRLRWVLTLPADRATPSH